MKPLLLDHHSSGHELFSYFLESFCDIVIRSGDGIEHSEQSGRDMGVGLLVHLVLFIDIEEIIVLVLVSWKVNLKRTREKSDHSPLVY